MALNQITNIRQLHEAMVKAACAPMSEYLSHKFIEIVMLAEHARANSEMVEDISGKLPEIGGFIVQIILKRWEVHTPNRKYDPFLTLLLDALSAGSPGNAVMWAGFAAGLKEGHPGLDFVIRIFGNGFPTEAAMSEIWNAQKSEQGHNLIDTADFWKIPQLQGANHAHGRSHRH